MRFNLGIAVIMALVSSCAVAAKEFPFCKGKFAKRDEICKKFHFPPPGQGRTCVTPKNGTTFFDISDLPKTTFSDHGRKMAQLITNVFENGNKQFQYQYVEYLGDGRGYTSGRIGFTTGTNDAYRLIKKYYKKKKSPLSRFLPELKRLSDLSFCSTKRDDISGLKGYKKAWKRAACKDADFRKAQDKAVQQMYMEPALRFAGYAKVKTELGKAMLYDVIIQHGWQYTEPDINIWRLINLSGGPRRKNESESSFLMRLITTRREMACCANDDVWPESASRMDDWMTVIRSKNFDLKKPVVLKNFGVTVTGKENPRVLNKKECKPFLKKGGGGGDDDEDN
ncbi:uncharacterized protein VTP21DRAFT_8610 [Calcarisporiella thermophila]|uniref:uncharacterized protein n=1 Tax=Calcarisporiella thermophila TaxID=911321 RepID=UPI003744AD7D